MRMCVDCPVDAQMLPFGEGLVGTGEAGRVEDRGGAITKIDQIGRVPEALVDERVDLHHEGSSNHCVNNGYRCGSLSSESLRRWFGG